MHLVCRCSLPVWRRSFLKKGTPGDLFWPRPGSAPGGIWPKNNNTCKGPWVLHPYQVSSKSIQRFWRRSRKSEKFTDGRTDGRRTDDGRTDDGRCAMTIAHSSLRLGWAKNASKIWLRNGTKSNNTTSHMLLDHCYEFRLLLYPSSLKKKFVEEGDPAWPILAPPLIRPWGDLAEKQQHL